MHESDWITLRDGTLAQEKWVCHCQHCQSHPDGPEWAEERYSLGIYAGKGCDQWWDTSGYRKDGPEGYDYLDAGEHYGSDY